MPTAPNITTGFVIEVDPDRIEETGESVEEALTRILSAGFAEEDTDHGIDIAVEGVDGVEATDDAGGGEDGESRESRESDDR